MPILPRLKEWQWLIILLLIAVVLGGLIASNFGESTDEYGDYLYAKDNLRAYAGFDDFLNHFNREFYGPAHLTFSYLVGELATRLPLGWIEVDGRHFANYLTFLGGIVAFYYLLRLFFRESVAAVTTLLFATQPLLFGSSFINQKDIPFMAMMVVALASGFYAIRSGVQIPGEHNEPQHRIRNRQPLSDVLGEVWTGKTNGSRIVIGLLIAGLVFLGMDLLLRIFLYPLSQELIARAYREEGPVVLGNLFRMFATDSYKTPLSVYLEKFRLIYSWTSVLGIVGIFLISGILVRRTIPKFFLWLTSAIRTRLLITTAAGVALGFATAIRVAGPLVGIVVIAYGFYRLGRKAIGFTVIYWLTWAVTAYLLWPYLWTDPIHNFLQTIELMGTFPPHNVLYSGQIISSHDLPWHYLPWLIIVQLTLTSLLLMLSGFAIGLFNRRNRGRLPALLLISTTFLVPAILVVVFNRPVYGNLRQLYFILPPLFLWIAFSVETLMDYVSMGAARVLILSMLILPGLFHLVRLHPYQYAYYNALIGNSRGAFGQFALDYWCTSYREAMEYLNSVAPENSTIGVWGPLMSARAFAREDLVTKLIEEFESDPEYVLGCKFALYDENFFPEMQTIYEVKRAGAVFAIVKSTSE